MRRSFGVAVLALALLTAGPAPAAQGTGPGAIAQGIADNLRETLPRQYGPNLVLVDAVANGPMLVLTVEFRNGASLGRPELARLFTQGFCEEGMDEYFENGLRLRIDIRAAGQSQAGIVIDRCPAR